MDNAAYFKELEARVVQLKQLHNQCSTFASGIIGQTLFKEDLFFCASLDRCVQLSEGFILMLQQRNLTCIWAILRLLMDNCMRTYAAFIAEDKDAVIDCIINGKRISGQKDCDGNKMSDAYLKKKMTLFNKYFSDVYDCASGYIHFSDKAFYQTVISCNDKTLEWQIGQSLQERFNPLMLEAADAFIHFTKLNYKMLQAVADSKRLYDAAHEGDAK